MHKPMSHAEVIPLTTLRATPGVGQAEFGLITETNLLSIVKGVKR